MSLFGRNRDDRRRRNLAEESAGESIAPSAAASSKPASKVERYTAAARRENHRHTTDFIPRSWLKLAICYVAALTVVGGLLFGYVKLGGGQNDEPNNSFGLATLFDAAQGASLAGWLSSLLFGFSAAASLLIYSIRRHKLDDYRGSYRLWLWCAAAWLVMSIDATANLHTPFSLAMARLTGWSMLTGGAIWWVGIWGGIVAILALRLLLEVRQSRTATLGFTLTFSLWAAALATEFGWLPHSEHAALIAIGGRLVGQVTLFFTIALYARHVLLDAEGLLTFRPPKPKREKPPKKAKVKATANDDDDEPAKTSRIDAPHKSSDKPAGSPLGSFVARANGGSTASTSSVTSAAKAPASYGASKNYSSTDDDDDRDNNRPSKSRGSQSRFDDEDEDEGDDDSYGGNRKLSKAERKRIRKQMRRQQRDDEE